ncbi:hypothetical protein [Candidatus Protochlamydia phocaeensis]|uniref:hypothetical protein n=1 Tax=Candidatus Protochlamydia phocaeensis TaxID=1414722 RepID=UPI0012AC2CD3|nr:hypothetical protein [Candidatus Protochlamydia phocaeensis]
MMDSSKVKKRWLLLLVTMSLVLPLFNLGVEGAFLSNEAFKLALIETSIQLFVGLIWALVMYFCAYKKPGTGLLTFQLVLGVIGLIKMPAFLIDDLKQGHGQIRLYLNLINIGITIGYYVLSYQLRKINKAIQSAGIQFSDLYTEALADLQQAATIKELDTRFGSLMWQKNNGDLQREEAIIAAYKSQKNVLLGQAPSSS